MKSKNTIKIFLAILFLINVTISCSKDEEGSYGIFIDPRDGQVYKTVKIGEQTWMAENLNYDVDTLECDTSDTNLYGQLYNWETACEVCPDGWHLPQKDELIELVEYLGGEEVAGNKLKDTLNWYDTNDSEEWVFNSSGFSALPAGRALPGSCMRQYRGSDAYFWSSSEYEFNTGDYGGSILRLLYFSENSIVGGEFKWRKLSVRCLKD